MRNKKLGKGLSALMGGDYETKSPVVELVSDSTNEATKELVKEEAVTLDQKNVIQMVSIDNIVAGIYQPRRDFDQGKLEDLSRSIQINGIIQPILVRRADNAAGVYEIIAGERRFRASKMAGMEAVPVIIKELTDLQAIEYSIIENVQRADLSAIEEANGYQQLISEFEYTQDEVAKRVGRSRSYITNILRLLTLPEDVQELTNKHVISVGHARALVGCKNASEIAARILEEGLSVRDIEEIYQGKKAQEAGEELVREKVQKTDLRKRDLKNQYLRVVESNLSSLIGGLKVKASYDVDKGKGKVTIFYNDLGEVESLIESLEK